MLLQMALFHSFLLLSSIPLYVCVCVTYLLYPLLCQWIFRLLPCLGSYKQHCNEHWGACILSDYHFLWIYAHEWNCYII